MPPGALNTRRVAPAPAAGRLRRRRRVVEVSRIDGLGMDGERDRYLLGASPRIEVQRPRHGLLGRGEPGHPLGIVGAAVLSTGPQDEVEELRRNLVVLPVRLLDVCRDRPGGPIGEQRPLARCDGLGPTAPLLTDLSPHPEVDRSAEDRIGDPSGLGGPEQSIRSSSFAVWSGHGGDSGRIPAGAGVDRSAVALQLPQPRTLDRPSARTDLRPLPPRVAAFDNAE